MATAGIGVLARPFGARAQPPAKLARIGLLGLDSAEGTASRLEALRSGLRDLGYVEGKSIVMESRWADGHAGRLPDLADELVDLKVDVLVTHGTAGARAAKRATATIPIVMTAALDAIGARRFDAIICNYANADMVGHSGSLAATVRAVGTVDGCLARALASAEGAGATLLVTADHGNCEVMVDPVTGGPHTAHTTNPVPFVIVGDGIRGPLRHGGSLRDVGPTILRMLGVEPPPEMTGRDLREDS